MVKVDQTPHPVRLEDVVFPEFNFKRHPDSTTPLKFPEFEIFATQSIEPQEKSIIVALTIKSKIKPKTYALSFNIVVIALYKCQVEENAEEILNQFSSQHTQYTLVWPYIREFISRMVQETGLPHYHVPLILRWETTEEGKTSSRVSADEAHSYFLK